MLLHQFYVSALEMRGAYETLTTKKNFKKYPSHIKYSLFSIKMLNA
jgi:hypothetical protein